ncbi:transposase [Streptomyces sp. NPDC056160]|uniref:transposase n=1 Tax=Streptomyces sp. NPDC056160 TaxID=3345731 RepID=UPI0035DF9862
MRDEYGTADPSEYTNLNASTGSPAAQDAGYGDAAAFRHGVRARGLKYAVGLSTTLSAQPGDAAPVNDPYSGHPSADPTKHNSGPLFRISLDAQRRVSLP